MVLLWQWLDGHVCTQAILVVREGSCRNNNYSGADEGTIDRMDGELLQQLTGKVGSQSGERVYG